MSLRSTVFVIFGLRVTVENVMTKLRNIPDELVTVWATHQNLSNAVYPEKVEDVLSSLQFRRVIVCFEVTCHGSVKITMRRSLGISLDAIFSSRGVKGSESEYERRRRTE